MYRPFMILLCSSFATTAIASESPAAFYYAIQCNKASLAVSPTDEELGACDRALESGKLSRKNLASVHSNRGVVLAKRGQLDAALREQKLAHRLHKRSGRICMNVGNAYFRKGDYERALIFYDRAVKLARDFPLVYANRSLAHAALGQQREAARDLLLAESRRPEPAVQSLGSEMHALATPLADRDHAP
jgi:tetratricopeptide (TPR) repeat protein